MNVYSRSLCCGLFLVAAVIISQLTSVAFAEGNRVMTQARKYYYGIDGKRDLQKALALYLRAADTGNADAEFIAGGMFYKGMGTPVNYTKAFELLNRAAKKGKTSIESERIIGQAYLIGRGVPPNHEEAIKWLRRAAVKGDREAQNELALLYYNGNGVPFDFEKAYSWFLEAAKRGLGAAQYNVGLMIYEGLSKEADLAEAHSWFTIALANGYSLAGQMLALVEENLSDEELAMARKRTEQLYEEVTAYRSRMIPVKQ